MQYEVSIGEGVDLRCWNYYCGMSDNIYIHIVYTNNNITSYIQTYNVGALPACHFFVVVRDKLPGRYEYVLVSVFLGYNNGALLDLWFQYLVLQFQLSENTFSCAHICKYLHTRVSVYYKGAGVGEVAFIFITFSDCYCTMDDICFWTCHRDPIWYAIFRKVYIRLFRARFFR